MESVGLGKLLPGAVNDGGCTFSQGYYENRAFIVYASGPNVIILTEQLEWVQTLSSAGFGYPNVRTNCVHCAALGGKIAAGWGNNVAIFQPTSTDTVGKAFPAIWQLGDTLSLDGPVFSVCWKKSGSQLLVGGDSLSLWSSPMATARKDVSLSTASMKMVWSCRAGFADRVKSRLRQWDPWRALDGRYGSDIHPCVGETSLKALQSCLGLPLALIVLVATPNSPIERVGSPIHYLKYSSDNQLFASAALNSRQVKVWFKQKQVEHDDPDESINKEANKDVSYGFVYLNHPNTVTGFMWRKLSPLMPVGYVSNVLLTYCVDNICRLWKHQIRSRRRTRYSRLRFHIAITISPNSDIPFRSTMPVKDAPFTVHWLDNKEMAFTRKAEKVRKGYTGVLSHHPSISSLQSQEDENQKKSDAEWDYVESFFSRSDSMSEEFDVPVKSVKYYSSDWCYSAQSPLPSKPTVHIGSCSIPTKDFLRFLDDWCNSSDLLLCVHPNSGSLMIWTVEGLDSSPTCHKLAHVNFSSCLPHIFPPADAFTLRQELLTFRHKPVLDSVTSQDVCNESYDGLVVLHDTDGQGAPTAGGRAGEERTVDPVSSLSVLSCHTNGSLNLWSVELGPLPFTSVSGLIHLAHISGHHSAVTNIVKHPSLPIVVTTSSVSNDHDGELIVWRMGQLCAYNVKNSFTDLSRISSSHANSFNRVAWFPVMCNINNASNIPVSGIFVTNIGKQLSLFDSNFFSSYSINMKRVHSSFHSLNSFSKIHPTPFTPPDISTFTGSNSLSCIGSLEGSLSSSSNSISFMHVYSGACFPFHPVKEEGLVLYVLVLENVLPDGEAQLKSYHSYTGIKTVAHLWQVIMMENTGKPTKIPSHYVASYPPVGSWEQRATADGTATKRVTNISQNYLFHSKKISAEPLPLPHGVYIEQCQSVCDVHANNKFTTFSSFIFATSCSDGVLRFWKYCSPEDAKATTDHVQGKDQRSWICDMTKPTVIACGIDFTTIQSTFSSYSLSSTIPATFSFANPGCVAVVFYLSKPPAEVAHLSASPTSQYALLTVWECISSAGQQWTCQTRKILSCPTASFKGSKSSAVLLDWIPVGNGCFILACCFGANLSLYSIVNINSVQSSGDPWVLLCSGNVIQSDVRLDASLLAHVGNSTIVTSTDCEFTIISLKAVCSKNLQFVFDNARDVISRSAKDTYSIIEEVYSSQSPLPEYHPQVLTDLISAGRLDLVNIILLNIAQYTMVKEATMGSMGSDIDSLDYDISNSDTDIRQRLLSISSEGMIRKSKKAKLVDFKGTIPCLKLSQCSVVPTTSPVASRVVSESDSDLFVSSSLEEYVAFSDEYNDAIDMSQFSPQVAGKLVKALQQTHLLPGLTVVEQVCLVAIIDTVANTRLSCAAGQSGHHGQVAADSSGVTIALSSGAGYAMSGEIKGGGEAMDDCGLRYLLKLKNHITFQDYIPEGAKRDDLPPHVFIWAFHSDAESELLSSIPCVQCDHLTWSGLREAGVGWWIRSNDTLRRLIEKVAKAQFTDKQEPLDASLFYLAMKKQNVLKLLFKNVGDERMTNFFKNDFTQHRWSTAALKNAFALLAKQRFEHAAAFFLLANKLWDAVEVCISRLHDPQLALVIVRLFEGDGGPTYNRFLKEHILGIQCGSKSKLVPHSNPFLRSIAYWLIQDYSQSMETLLDTPANCMEDCDFAAVFNFYFFLRSHPLLLRRKFAADSNKAKSEGCKYISSVGSEKLTSFECRLLFHTALHYLQCGCPLITLDVLTKLPDDESLLLRDDLISEDIEQTQSVTMTTMQNRTIFTPELKDAKDDDIDWGQPVANQKMEDDIDWGKPVAMEEDFDWSQPISFQIGRMSESESLDPSSLKSEGLSPSPQPITEATSTSNGHSAYSDIVSFFRQLKFDTCLAILTKSLLTLSSCSTKTLKDTFQEWLHKELHYLEAICRHNTEQLEDDLIKRNHELIIRLYWSVCHQSNKPSTLDHIKLELLLLLQDNIQSINNDSSSSTVALYRQEVPNCILEAKQIPLLTCTMLPFAHPFSLAFYLKSLIQKIVECVSSCTLPIAVANRQRLSSLPQLCETLSNCVSLIIGVVPDDTKQRLRHETVAAQYGNLSKWPGVPNWPNLLPSDEGRDPVHISVLLAECLLTVYMGLLAHTWSEHHTMRLLYLTANCPTREVWIRVFGGALPLNKLSKKRTGSRGKLVKSQEQVENAPTVFIPPRQTLIDAFTSKPSDPSRINYKFPKEKKDLVRSSSSESLADEDNPFCYTWSLMNTGITKIVKDAVKSILANAGMEVTELPVCSPLLHLVMKILDLWEENFQAQLESFGGVPSELMDGSPHRGQGPALLRHKSILEPENSPFRSFSDTAEVARKLWEYLIKQEDVREMFIHNLFSDKNTSNSQDAGSTILYKDIDGEVSTFCLNSVNPTVIAAATTREILEIDVTDILMSSDSYTITEEYCDVPGAKQNLTPNYPSTVNADNEDFLVVHPTRSPQSHHHPFYSMGMDLQTGTSANMLLRRAQAGVKELEAHPTLPYYLSGSQSGAIFMWEFANAKPIVVHQVGGSGIMKIRFTPQGNKFGVADLTGRLLLWQGLHSNEKGPYQALNCHVRTLYDFAFLSSSSFIATVGDAVDNNNLCLWDTLLPERSALVHKYTCLESGASAVAHSPALQLLVAGGKRGEVCVFDIRHHVLLRTVPAHSSAINSIVVNDIEGYFVTGSCEGEIKIWDLSKLSELRSYSGEHSRSRLFRSEGGVMHLYLTTDNNLYSSGADGSLKCRTLVLT